MSFWVPVCPSKDAQRSKGILIHERFTLVPRDFRAASAQRFWATHWQFMTTGLFLEVLLFAAWLVLVQASLCMDNCGPESWSSRAPVEFVLGAAMKLSAEVG
mmetsp:Transcript_89053/g.203705  ORF Transcript_89053/g.203705 Transcript_89053/m.203705 type:complete len:102 (+) Transcript_89053:274-579(+)